MKQFVHLALLTAIGAMMWVTAPVHGALTGLVVFREEPGGSGPAPPGPERWIYRVYAEFTDGSDRVSSWGLGSGFGEGGVFNVTVEGQPGSGFTNIPNDDSGNLAPFAPGTPRDWDTYMTIGVLYGQEGPGGLDGTLLTPMTPMFIPNGSTAWNPQSNLGVGPFIFPGNPQGRADYRIAGNDTDQRVLLMQLVVNAGEHVSGTLGLSWSPQGGLVSNLQFTSVPEPSSILALAALFAFRRSRHQSFVQPFPQ